MEKVSIGVLLPSSTILPISKDFEKGLKDGLKPLVESGTEVEIVKEFIGQGDIKLTENACNKFFNYDDVDLVTGILSNKATQIFADRFKGQQKPLLVNNLGGHVPDVRELNEYIFINSAHLWQHAWAMGNWGVSRFGKKGMFIGAVYDAGYSFSQMFYLGMQAADPQSEWSFSVPPMPPAGGLSDMIVIFPFLEKYEPDFIFVTFCGAETTLFLNEFIKRGWHHKTKILGLPYLLAPFAPLDDDITIYTSLPFESTPEIAPAKAFYHLGLQTGLNITEAAHETTDAASFKNKLTELNRMFNVNKENELSSATDNVGMLTIVQNHIKVGEKTFTSKSITSANTFGLNIERMKSTTNGISSTWYNPYLCI